MDRETEAASIICHYHYKSKTADIQPYDTCPVYSTGTDTCHIHPTVPLREKQKDMKIKGERKKRENISTEGDSFTGSVNEMWPSLPPLRPGSGLPAPFSSFDLPQAPTERELCEITRPFTRYLTPLQRQSLRVCPGEVRPYNYISQRPLGWLLPGIGDGSTWTANESTSSADLSAGFLVFLASVLVAG